MLYLFFFNDTATTEIYTLSLHDALPICTGGEAPPLVAMVPVSTRPDTARGALGNQISSMYVPLPVDVDDPLERVRATRRSEEHTSELQSRQYLVCRLLLEKKKNQPECSD